VATAKYKFHEAANLFPMIAEGAEWDSFKADVLANGVIDPVTFWKNAKGEKVYIDGRNRLLAVEQLRESGHEVKDPPEKEFKGKSSDVLAHVLAKNLQGRRHLKSGQRAAVAAKAGLLVNLYRKKEGGDQFTDIGDLAEYLARLVGSNRDYIYKTLRLQSNRPSLLDKVIAGKLSILAAEKEWAESKKDKEEDAGPNIKDGRGNPADPRFLQEFAARDQFDEVDRLFRQLKGALGSLAAEAGAVWADFKEADAFVSSAQAALSAASPYAVCPECAGEQRLTDPRGGKRKIRCGRCEGRGFVNEARYQGMPAEAAALTAPEEPEGAAAEAAV
jgi:hypothetical protein